MTERKTDLPLDQMPEHLRNKELYWREVLRNCDRSKQGIASYCRTNGICANSLYQWRRELTRRDEVRSQLGEETALTFVPLTVVQPGEAGALEVLLACDRRIRLLTAVSACLETSIAWGNVRGLARAG